MAQHLRPLLLGVVVITFMEKFPVIVINSAAKMDVKIQKKFKHTLDSLGWPIPLKVPLPNELQERKSVFTRAFCELLLLQNPTGVEDSDEIVTIPLFPIQLMSEPLITRFR
ncbi:9765_t:CDS:2 [Ambispora leptoticha]|uniref:9765_t:CDS:1 n=1 Tax=Ambispora leptoticha TaxID=144679 RepID=A0A9N9BHA9_9GLOM|nr:9765_t:CDS:2 [Ambispora leptoticha]